MRGDLKAAQMKYEEKICDYYSRLLLIVNKMRRNGEKMKDIRVMEKLFRSLTSKFKHVMAAIEESKNLVISIEELWNLSKFMSNACKRKLVP